ncbi:cytochrome P450 [Gymnopus androsaceus JB14]|uniref:Cytochrome P450 n=1 Tax=Gymnopus androsaceus JB14 TaxID=1447944 RepID=A0A6A4GB88_9AGAR|nr:cytochrome P450 [Gymnopus androsaceus JB14]
MAQISSTLLASSGLAASTMLALIYFFRRREEHSTVSYPPGPKGATMPMYDTWVEFRNWGNEYGDLVYLPGMNLLILNHSRVAIDLLEKRGAHLLGPKQEYNGQTVNSHFRCGGELNLALAPYSDNWRKNRKLFQQNFRQSTINRFHPDQYAKVHELLRQLITTPDKFMQHILALSQRTIFSTLYGLDVDPDDPIAQTMKTGKGSSLIAELATKAEGNLAEITSIKAMGTTSISAAADTTASAIDSFILAMVLHPDVQMKGQEEIDRVLGRDRLPTFDDRLSLPYVEAIYREVLRLNPPLPLGKHCKINESCAMLRKKD